jgi:hypothetical protein
VFDELSKTKRAAGRQPAQTITRRPFSSGSRFVAERGLDWERGLSWEMGICPPRRRGTPARQRAKAVSEEDLFYISICSGGAIIKISAAERPNFVLGQLIIVGAAFVVTLVELTLWLAN